MLTEATMTKRPELNDVDDLEVQVRSYSLKQVAELLNVTLRTARRYVNDGKIKVFRPGGRDIRIRHVDLVRFIEERYDKERYDENAEAEAGDG